MSIVKRTDPVVTYEVGRRPGGSMCYECGYPLSAHPGPYVAIESKDKSGTSILHPECALRLGGVLMAEATEAITQVAEEPGQG